MEDVARVVLALEEHDVAEEVMHFLDRTGRARVVGTAADDRQLVAAVRQLEPDAIVAQPSLLERANGLGRCSVIALDTHESVASLRAAIRAGAAGFFVWPGEREQLASATVASLRPSETVERRAVVIGVHGARGGVGATFVATHLARAAAARGACILIEADPVFGDVATALAAPEDGVRTLADLLPLGDELRPSQLDESLWRHESGFGVLLPPPAEEASRVEVADVRRMVDAAGIAADVVIVHTSRDLGQIARAALDAADRIVEVLALDVLSFRAATRGLRAAGWPPDRVGFVVNRASRSEIVPDDVHRVFGADPLAVIPLERTAARAQDRGLLVPVRSRAGRIFARLAATMADGATPRESGAGYPV